jgi:hypothetical protein
MGSGQAWSMHFPEEVSAGIPIQIQVLFSKTCLGILPKISDMGEENRVCKELW